MIEGVMKYRIDFFFSQNLPGVDSCKNTKNKLGFAGVKLHVWLEFLNVL